MSRTNSQRDTAWSPDEVATATNLYEHGVHAREIADTLTQLYRKGRSPESVRYRMHLLGVVWGCRSASARVRADASAAAERNPWHPARDPKPQWLQR